MNSVREQFKKAQSELEDLRKFCMLVGQKVTKKRNGKNPKPFKSSLTVNTVKDIINHPQLNILAFTFVEDDSYVECRRCHPVEE